MLQNTTVLLGAGGGPLTWVAADVLRALQRAGAQVRVILRAETEIFIPALTFPALTGGEVVRLRRVLVERRPTVLASPGQAAVYQHALVQHNLQRLRAAGMHLYDAGIPDPTGATDGLGCSLSAQKVVDTVAECLQQTTALTGKVVIITAGPTQEPIDPVRHISNRSSGKTGFD